MADELYGNNFDACSLSFDDPEKNTADDQIDAVVLYADVDFTDPDAVAKRKAEWEALFGGDGMTEMHR